MPFRSRFLHRALVPVLALSAGAACAQPQQAPLDLDTALALAAARAPLLRASEAAAQAAREQAVAAGQRPDPVLRFGITNLPIDGPDRFSTSRDFMTMRSIGAMQEFTRVDKRSSRAASHEADAATALARRDERLAALRRDTALAWLERHDLERLRELLLKQRDEARLQIDAAEAVYRGGRGSQADVFMARAQVAALDDRIAAVDARIAQARIALERWVGHDAAQAPLGARPDVSVLVHDAAHLETRLDDSPHLVAREREIDKARADVAVARAERQSDWSAELMFNQRGSQYSNMVSLTLSVPLPTDRAQRQDRKVAASLAAVEQMQAERDEALREHQAHVRAWHRRLAQRRRTRAAARHAAHPPGQRAHAGRADGVPRRQRAARGRARSAPCRDRGPHRTAAARHGSGPGLGATRLPVRDPRRHAMKRNTMIAVWAVATLAAAAGHRLRPVPLRHEPRHADERCRASRRRRARRRRQRHRRRRSGDAPPPAARPEGRRHRPGERPRASPTTTTRWCPANASTSRASRRSWT